VPGWVTIFAWVNYFGAEAPRPTKPQLGLCGCAGISIRRKLGE